MRNTNEALSIMTDLEDKKQEYRTIWCRLENGGYWHYRSYPTHAAERIVREFNESAPSGRLYCALPLGFDAKLLGRNRFALTVLQAMEDELQHPDDRKYSRIKEQVVELALVHHGMTMEEIQQIEAGLSALLKYERCSI